MQHRDGLGAGVPPGAPGMPEPSTALGGGTPLTRVETAVTPIIRAEAVPIPTPAWGALTAEDTAVLESEFGESGALSQSDPDGAEWGASDLESTPRSAWLGWGAFLLALSAAVVHGIAVVADAGKDYVLATILAWVAIGVSGAAVLAGIVAAVLGRGRGPGIAAALVGAVANPWLLLQMLTLLRG